MGRIRRTTALVVVSCLAVLPSTATAAPVTEGATWSEATIPSSDGVELHADILRPSHLDADEKTPVILSIGPYFNHAGQLGAVGPAQGEDFDATGPSEGPSGRFYDLVEGARLMERGYTFVMVDLRGFGGSSGCLDWAGPGETADVVSAVEWAASQPWSTGKVGMYGKSYDGVTGLIGVNEQPEGLAAVVAQEPVYDLYRYLYGDGIRRLNSVLTPALYDGIALSPGPLLDDPGYNANGANSTSRPGCEPANWADQALNDDHFSDYWRARDLIPGATGSEVPLFLTQGLPENNTVPDGLAQYMENHTGYERAWLGPWDHVRGAETNDEGQLLMGREGWYDEVNRFYDRFLKGEEPAVDDPLIAIQTNDGKWRGEEEWPPADSAGYTTALRPGAYTDEGNAGAWGGSATTGVWTISPPLERDTHLAGSGSAVVDVSTALPRSNVVVNVYDLDASGTGPLVTRQAHMIRNNGPIELDLWSTDWIVRAGHRIAVRVADANTDWWVHVPTNQDVTVHGGSITLPFLSQARETGTIQGDPSPVLDRFLGRTVTLAPEVIAEAETAGFATPAEQTGGGGKPGKPGKPPRGPKKKG